MRLAPLIVLATSLVIATPASGGVFTDDLSRCVVEKSSDADKVQITRWVFAAMSKDPSLINMANISQSERDRLTKGTADLISRLILVDCRAHTVAALKNEGTDAFGQAGRVLGAAAMRKLMSSPEGGAELNKLGDYVDEKAWQALGEEAGIKIDDN